MATAAPIKRHPAGWAYYPGDVTRMVGEIKGPLTYGGYVVAIAAVYNADAGRSAVKFAHATAEDLQSCGTVDGRPLHVAEGRV